MTALLGFLLGLTLARWLARGERRSRLFRKRLHRLLHRVRDRALTVGDPRIVHLTDPTEWLPRLTNARRN